MSENKPEQKASIITSDYIQELLSKGKVDEALRLMQAREQLGKLAQEEEAQTEFEKAQEARLLQIAEEEARRLAVQEECPHLKDNGRPAIGGNRDSRNNTIFICLRCQKMWQNESLPMYLRANLPDIGGPTFS